LQLPEDAGEVTFDRAVLAHPSLAAGHLDRRQHGFRDPSDFSAFFTPAEGNDTGRVPQAATAASNTSPETPEAGEARPTSGSASALLPSTAAGLSFVVPGSRGVS
jgi:hypothetical protein